MSYLIILASYPSGPREQFAKLSFAGSNPADASIYARVVELVDTRDLKSLERIVHAGSSPAPGTREVEMLPFFNYLQIASKNIHLFYK